MEFTHFRTFCDRTNFEFQFYIHLIEFIFRRVQNSAPSTTIAMPCNIWFCASSFFREMNSSALQILQVGPITVTQQGFDTLGK